MSCDDSSLSDTAKHKWEETSSGGVDMRGCSVLSPLHHICIQMPHTATLYCLTLQGLGRFRSPASHQRRTRPLIICQLVSGDQPYLQRCDRLGTTVVGSGLNMRWEQWNAKPGSDSISLATYHYAYNSDMPQTTLIVFCMTAIFLSWLEVLPNRAWIFLNSCDERNEALNHFEAMPCKCVLLL